MPRIIRHRRARADLLEIWRHIAEDSGEVRADAYLSTILQKLEVLASQPGIGRSRDELGQNLRSLPVASHLIIYGPLANGVEVVRVLHGKRDILAALEEEDDD